MYDFLVAVGRKLAVARNVARIVDECGNRAVESLDICHKSLDASECAEVEVQAGNVGVEGGNRQLLGEMLAFFGVERSQQQSLALSSQTLGNNAANGVGCTSDDV